MNNFPTSAIDICVAVIFAISALLAFSRGAVRETLGIGSWIGAAIATVYGFQYVRSIASNLIDHKLIADAATGIVIFVLALITCTIIAQFLAGRIQRSRMGALDRTLGIVFGLFRGAILVCLAYMLFIWAVEKDDRPDWVDQALTMPYIIHGADM